ncbi:amino acid adenylation domain-containing protein [Solwaraspora sp. WMMD1047]|nr:amino acid adenylation domain-containing protein [Solwaraspora sp. WMMD1047]MDG4829280.1 amino acid adenylation domain-containing protein [Solwaraspora sp. WMMD1047]
MIRKSVPALSSAQSRMWFAYKVDPASAEFTVVWAARLIGAVDPERLAAAWRAVLRTHDELRLRLSDASAEPSRDYWPVEDMAMSLRAVAPEALPAELESAVGRVFMLDKEPLVDLTLLRLGSEEHVMVVSAHHAVLDGRSLDIVIEGLFTAYSGRPGTPAGASYRDYIEQEAAGTVEPSLVDRWVAELRLRQESDSTPLGLPLHSLSQDKSAGTVTQRLSPETWSAIRDLARGNRTTPHVVGLAAFALTLARYRDTESLLVGASMDTRSARFADTIGTFVNPVPVRLGDLADASVTDLVRATHASLLRSYKNRSIPFDQLVRRVHRGTDTGTTPVFQVLFNFEPTRTVPDVAGLRVQPLDTPVRVSQYELTLTLREDGDAAELVAVYRRERHAEQDIRGLLSSVRSVLQRIAASDDASNDLVVSDEERRHLLELGRGVEVVGDLRPVHEQVVDMAGRWPDRMAVVAGPDSLTYAELERRSLAMAHVLHGHGVGRQTRVGVHLSPSADAVVAVLAVLRAGATYVPLQPSDPPARIHAVLADAGIDLLVTESADFPGVKTVGPHSDVDHEAPLVPLPEARLGDCAYVIYTSGTTGEPKGVVVEHAALANSTAARHMVYPGTHTFLLLSPLSFDSSMAGLWGTLTAGGCLVVADTDEVRDPRRILEAIRRHSVTIMLSVPALYAAVLDTADRDGLSPPASLSTVITAGESLPDATAAWHFAWHPGGDLVNEYGPTETAVWSTFRRLRPGERVDIGGAAPGSHLYVLDRHGNLMPKGAVGELYIGGERVARGYLGKPELTDRVFVRDPFREQPSRMYRTGDWVRWNDDGGLSILGRRDQIVKLRGHRVDLGAVESSARSLEGVVDTAVLVAPSGSTLEAFVVVDGDRDVESIRTRLGELLPPPMVPSLLHRVDRLPRTSRGKVDRDALMALRNGSADGADRIFAAAELPGGVLAAIHAAWCEVLEVPTVAHDLNFFDAGGHSLLVPLLQAEIEDRLDITIDIVDLFTATTVAAQSAAFGRLTGAVEAGPVADPRQARLAAAGRAQRGRGEGSR